MEQDDKADHVLREWHSSIKRAKEFHYQRQGNFEHRDKILGICVIVLSIAASAPAFWSLGDANRWIGSGAALSGAAASAFASTQLLGNFRSEAIQNYNSAKEYNALQAELEEALSIPRQSVSDFMAAFRDEWGSVDKHAPYIPTSYYDRKDSRPSSN